MKAGKLVQVLALTLILVLPFVTHLKAQAESEKSRSPIEALDLADSKVLPGLKQTVKNNKDRLAQAEAKFMVNASPAVVWGVLTDFSKYPQVFKRISTCKITKREGDLVYLQSELKPHMFVKRTSQLTVNDLAKRPSILEWKLLDGNFKTVYGHWQLESAKNGQHCLVTYVMQADPGPVIPKFLVSFVLGFVQKEVATQLKDWIESGSPKNLSQTSKESEAKTTI